MNIKNNENEELRILQQERLILQVCLQIHKLMEEQNVTRSQLARRLGVAPARVTQILDGANLGLRQVSDIMLALNAGLAVDTGKVGFMTNIKPKAMPCLKYENYTQKFNRKAWKPTTSLGANVSGTSTESKGAA